MLQSHLCENLPTFSAINPNTIVKELKQLLNENRKQIKTLLKSSGRFTWDNLISPLEEIDDQLNKMWSPISHLHSVLSNPTLRKAYNKCIPLLSDYHTEIAHNEPLFNAIESLAKSDEYERLDEAQRKVIDDHLRDFKLAGVNLPTKEKKQFAKLSKQLSKLTTQFEEHLLDATMGWHKHVESEAEVAGIPEHAVNAAKHLAEKQKKSGWIFSLEFPSYIAVMTYADNRALRESMYRAYTTRASDQGPNAGKWDNSNIMHEIVSTRFALAKLLGFDNYAERSLATKMVKAPQQVLNFLNQLVPASLPKAKEEFTELENFAREELGLEKLNAWDVAYASEKLRQHRYDISQETLRPYFPEDKVLTGLFNTVKKLFQIDIKEIKDFDKYINDLRCFAVYDANGKLCSQFYIDLYARENKRGGAWMDECRVRRRLATGAIQIPVAYLTCNLNPPVGSDPALFSHDEVVTLFHEFGHCLQHMLTKIDYADVSGINGIPWDAVEVASQFLENWAWQKESLNDIAQHYKTGEALPDDLFDKMLRAKHFHTAMGMMRQLEFALFDFRLHMEFNPHQSQQIQTILDEVRKQVSVVPTPEFNRFQHSFSHIFAGGYAAGYYSYKWAEVMACDAFELFLEKGIFDRDTSARFLHTFLESGGAKEPMDVFIEFRGREPKVDALLRQSGIV